MFSIRSLFTCLLQPFEIFRRPCGDNDYPSTNPEEEAPLIPESGQSDQSTPIHDDASLQFPDSKPTPNLSLFPQTATLPLAPESSENNGQTQSNLPGSLQPIHRPRQYSASSGQTELSDASRSRASSNSEMKQRSLKEQLESRRIECPHRKHSFFIPQNTLEELITPSLVSRDIQTYKGITPAKALEHVKIACQSAQKLYAVLSLVKKGSHISDLLDAQVTDKDLPLERRGSNFALYRKSKNLEDDPISVFADWNQKEREKFDRFQWWMTAPVFEDKEHYELDDKTILPFIPFQNRGDIKKPIQGGYSEVYPVRLHPAHHKFSILGPEDKEPLVAVKKLISTDDEEFQKEVTILKILGSKRDPHPNLLKLLCTYRQEDKYHLLFRYANANLRKYWDDRPTPDFDSTNVLWSIRQMTGIASALQVVHNFRVTIPLGIAGAGKGPGGKRVQKDAELSVQHGEDLYGRHGDIKPENILWFQTAEEGSDEGGILQIADFGLGRFHGRESRSKINPDTLARTGTYEPPECKLRQPVSRAYDIWSLGCLYLEYITWMLKGPVEIESFADHRGRLATNGIINDDCFYTIINDPVVGPEAQVREGVLTWVEELHRHEKCSALIHDLLAIVMEGLLVIDSKERWKATWLTVKMKELLDKAETDRKYMLQPTLEKKRHNNRTHSESIVAKPSIVLPREEMQKVDIIKPLPEKPLDSVLRSANAPRKMRKGKSVTWPKNTTVQTNG